MGAIAIDDWLDIGLSSTFESLGFQSKVEPLTQETSCLTKEDGILLVGRGRWMFLDSSPLTF